MIPTTLYLINASNAIFNTHNLTSAEIALFPTVTNISEFDSGDGFSSPHDAALRTAFSTLFSTSATATWTALQNYIAGLGCTVPDLSWFNALVYFFPESFYSGVAVYLNDPSCFGVAGNYSIIVKYAANTIKRVQNYSVKVTNSPQPLCSLKETAFTKISGFRKYTL